MAAPPHYGSYGYWNQTAKHKKYFSILTVHRAPQTQIRVVANPRDLRSMGQLFNKMSQRYVDIVWKIWANAVPELYKEAGRLAYASGVPWEVVGPFAKPTVVPASAMKVGPDVMGGASAFGGPTRIGLPVTGSQAQMVGQKWPYQTKPGKAPIGFGFKTPGIMGDIFTTVKYNYMSGKYQTAGKPNAPTWAIPQAPAPGHPWGASPWMNERTWAVHGGAQYPPERWLWREELGLAGKQTAGAVVRAMENIPPTAIWPAPPYTAYRRSGYVIAQGKKIGIHWIPPSNLGMTREIKDNLENSAWDEDNA